MRPAAAGPVSPAGNCVRTACTRREADPCQDARPVRRHPPVEPAVPPRPALRGDSTHLHPWEGGMKMLKSKKGLVLLATLAVAVMAAVGAYAYFTNSGTATKTAAATV